MNGFNLVDDPWIPVRWADGRKEQPLVGLSEAFRESPCIAGLACAPHERVALTRLLVCATQAALGAPPSPHHWHGWGADMAARVPEYLAKWRHRFELFGDGPRFLQHRAPTFKQKPRHEFLEFKLKNNEVVFDHHSGTNRAFDNARLSLGLVTLQNFFLPGSTGPPNNGGVVGSGPAINYLHSFLIGINLSDTIVLNCLDALTIGACFRGVDNGIGRPIWEFDNPMEESGLLISSYLGRLVPIPCSIWLTETGGDLILSQGIEYPEFKDAAIREPSSTVVVFAGKNGKGDDLRLLMGNPERSIWRDLHLIAPARERASNIGEQAGPLIYQSHLTDDRMQSGDTGLWCAELCRDTDSSGKRIAKLADVLEGFFPSPGKIFTVEGQDRYEKGVGFASGQERVLLDAIAAYTDLCRPRPTGPSRSAERNYPLKPAAQQHYWHALDKQSAVLLKMLENMHQPDDPLASGKFGERQGDTPADPWTRAVFAAAESAYAAVCPRATPRQLQAYTAGLRVLRKRPAASKSKAKTPAP